MNKITSATPIQRLGKTGQSLTKSISTLLLTSFLLAWVSNSVFAQNKSDSTNNSEKGVRWPSLDKSPMDMSFYPSNYPILKIQDKTSQALQLRVIYSRPQCNGRKVFGGLVEMNKIWRLGANEATEFECFKDVKIGGKLLKKGRYTLYAIPLRDQWTIIFNRELDTWGAFKYNPAKDVLKITVPVEQVVEKLEYFSIQFQEGNNNLIQMLIGWDDALVKVPISL